MLHTPTEDRPQDEAKPKAVHFEVPLDQSGNLSQIGIMNAIKHSSKAMGLEPHIKFVSYEAQQALTEAQIKALPLATHIAETVANIADEAELPFTEEAELPRLVDSDSVVSFPMTENGRDISDEPVEACEVEEPDWNRFKPEAAFGCVTPNQCYTTKQVARKLGVNPQAVHNLCYRNPKMAEALGRQQFQTGHKCYFLKSAVNAFCDSRKKMA